MSDKEQIIKAVNDYLVFWKEKDSKYCKVFSVYRRGWDPRRVDELKRAMAEYAIARNFRIEHESDKRYEPLFDIVDEIEQIDYPVETVKRCAKAFYEKYQQHLVSAASKLLWFKFKSPIVIYDKLAHEALDVPANASYADYYEKWRADYKDKAPMIRDACERLAHIDPVISEQWFRERVFDRYLWHKGKAE